MHFLFGIFLRVSLALFVSFQCWRAAVKSSGSPSRGLRSRFMASDQLLRSNVRPVHAQVLHKMIRGMILQNYHCIFK